MICTKAYFFFLLLINVVADLTLKKKQVFLGTLINLNSGFQRRGKTCTFQKIYFFVKWHALTALADVLK